MKILYIIRDRGARSWSKKLHRWSVGFLDGQDGFFEAALHRAGSVTRVRLDVAEAMTDAQRRSFDAVVVNAKASHDWKDAEVAAALVARYACPVALFLGQAEAENMPQDDALAPYSVIFKREPWIDLDRYGLSPTNTVKIRPTHLSNPLAPLSWRFDWEIPASRPRSFGWQVNADTDVFFIGSVIPSQQRFRREDTWARVISESFTTSGGLFTRRGLTVPDALRAEHLKKPAYLERLLHARINLGLEGIGSFTFRHLEIMWAGGFLLSNPTVREQRLRAPLIEGTDYLAFDDHDDMIDKIRTFVENDGERRRIAESGRRAYERLHDVGAHAAEIKRALRP